jgi:tripartite-type tricarboxylate transporter receptor subunit TctC
MNIPARFRAALLGALFLLPALSAQAQTWPTKPVTLIIPTSSSSAADIVGRAIQHRLQAMWKQPIIVDNRVGASGIIGFNATARAAADGYTIMLSPNTITMLGAIYKNQTWDVEQSYDPVALMVRTISAVIVNDEAPAKSVSELVALAKSKPGKLNYASPGIGTPQHLYGELFKQITGTDLVHIPYKTLAAAVTDLAGGRAEVGFLSLSAVMPLVKAGKMRVLATVGDRRTLPDVQTFKEAGLDAVQAGSWIGAFVPKNTPKDVVARITRDFNAILQQADFQQEMLRADLITNTSGNGGPELAALIKADVARWTKVVNTANITAP